MASAGVAGPPGSGAAAFEARATAPDAVNVRLTKEQIGLLRREGQTRRTVTGEVLFREGDRGYDFIVILAGQVVIMDHQAGTERHLATGGPGDFVAELNLLTGERLFITHWPAAPAPRS